MITFFIHVVNATKSVSIFHPRVLTTLVSAASCARFADAEPGTVWHEIFKNNMKIEESCIGDVEARKQMEKGDKLYTYYHQKNGKVPCSSVLFERSNTK